MSVQVSVVVPFYNAAAHLQECINGLASQSLPADRFEVILVDDGSSDQAHTLVENSSFTLIRQPNQGAPAARNTGIRAAQGDWVAFTDSDCIPSRNWLRALLHATRPTDSEPPALGAAGPVIGHQSTHPAARYVDISGGLDPERHLSHPLFPFAPTGNVMLRRDALEAAGGFDERFSTYDACDLFQRLAEIDPGRVRFARAAVVLHRHRDSWGGYWRQQKGYGKGLAEFYLKYRDRIEWSLGQELAAWGRLGLAGLQTLGPGSDDEKLARRGRFIKDLAQRTTFVPRYWSPRQRSRW